MDQPYDAVDEAIDRLKNALTQLKEARQIQKVFMSLGKELSIGSSQEEFLAIIIEAVQSLFPRTYYLVQLADPTTLVTTAISTNGPLREGGANRMHISKSAMVKTRLSPSVAQSPFVEVGTEVPHLFEGSAYAIHVPLVADNQLFGAIQLESLSEIPLGDDDELLLISLANQMALALRNQRLLEETAFLKDYLESILEYANALILVTNKNRQILVYNRAMEKLLGFSKNQILGTDLFIWLPQEEQEKFAAEISRTLEKVPSPTGVETRMRNRDGLLVQIVFNLAALRGRDGEIESVIMVGQDMTQVRSLERQIIEAEKMASLGKLAAGVVHELNNPLTSISVYAEYLVKKLAAGKIEPGDRDKAEKILHGAKRIQKLTRDLISYGRPSAEEPEPLQFNELVSQGLSFCEHTVCKYDVTVSSDLAAGMPPLIGNRNQLLQIIINLVTNACQAMEGGGELTLATRYEPPDTLLFTVSDTGVGIPTKDLEKVFEPFFTTKKDGEGTGLGLSIVTRIVEHHHGTIVVRSQLGEGTTFEVRLALAEGRTGHAAAVAPRQSRSLG